MSVLETIDAARMRLQELVRQNAELREEIARLRADRDGYRLRVKAEYEKLSSEFNGFDLAQLRQAVSQLDQAIEMKAL